MKMESLLEVLCAAHLSSRVEGPMHGYGGLMLVGPPEALKSTFLSVLERYPDSLTLSDVNVKSLTRLNSGGLATGSVRSLVFPEIAKLYERHDITSANVEGTLRALVAEGWSGASFQEPGVNRFVSHATVFGAMTPSTLDRKAEYWNDSGFARRFLWALIRLGNPELLQEAIDEWQSVDLGAKITSIVLPQDSIPNLTTADERRELKALIKYQPPHGGDHVLQRQFLVRILAVLKWGYSHLRRPARDPMNTLFDFGEALVKGGASVMLPSQLWSRQVRQAATRRTGDSTNGRKRRKVRRK